jgi:predicted transcriptional regulator
MQRGREAVDDTAHIIVAAELTNNPSDAGELPTMLTAVQSNLGETPQQVGRGAPAGPQTGSGLAAYRPAAGLAYTRARCSLR